MERGLWRVVGFDGFGARALFVDELDRGEEEVEQESPLGGIELVELSNKVLLIKAFVTKVLSDVSPVFSLDVGVVIFLVFSGSSVLHRPPTMGPVFKDWPVKELGSVVAVKATDFERQRLLNGFEGTDDALFAFTPDGSLFGPSGSDIDRIDGINEVTGNRCATVGNGVGFEEAGS